MNKCYVSLQRLPDKNMKQYTVPSSTSVKTNNRTVPNSDRDGDSDADKPGMTLKAWPVLERVKSLRTNRKKISYAGMDTETDTPEPKCSKPLKRCPSSEPSSYRLQAQRLITGGSSTSSSSEEKTSSSSGVEHSDN